MTARLAEGVIKDLYSNGMGYNQMVFSDGLSATLVTNKAIEGDLQGIDHPGRPAYCAVVRQRLRHPDGIDEQRHA